MRTRFGIRLRPLDWRGASTWRSRTPAPALRRCPSHHPLHQPLPLAFSWSVVDGGAGKKAVDEPTRPMARQSRT